MPFKVSHLAIVTSEQVDSDVINYAASVHSLTLACLTASGITVPSNPWKFYSRRYQESQAALAKGDGRSDDSAGTSGAHGVEP